MEDTFVGLNKAAQVLTHGCVAIGYGEVAGKQDPIVGTLHEYLISTNRILQEKVQEIRVSNGVSYYFTYLTEANGVPVKMSVWLNKEMDLMTGR